MNNLFQEQLLKAGVVNKQQVEKAKKGQHKKTKQQRHQKTNAVDETKLKAQKAKAEKAQRDRELNQRREEHARNKATSIEINQLIINNAIKRDDKCDIGYNFEHRGKVMRLYVNANMKQQIIKGSLGIARIEGRYELIPQDIAEKIQQRNDKRVVLFTEEPTTNTPTEDDPYADFQIPDDITW